MTDKKIVPIDSNKKAPDNDADAEHSDDRDTTKSPRAEEQRKTARFRCA